MDELDLPQDKAQSLYGKTMAAIYKQAMDAQAEQTKEWVGAAEKDSEHSAARIYRIVHEMLDGWEAERPGHFHHVVYAQLCGDPRGVLRGVAEFCGLSYPREFEESLPESLPKSNHKWRESLDAELLERIRAAEGPVLDRFTEEALTAR